MNEEETKAMEESLGTVYTTHERYAIGPYSFRLGWEMCCKWRAEREEAACKACYEEAGK